MGLKDMYETATGSQSAYDGVSFGQSRFTPGYFAPSYPDNPVQPSQGATLSYADARADIVMESMKAELLRESFYRYVNSNSIGLPEGVGVDSVKRFAVQYEAAADANGGVAPQQFGNMDPAFLGMCQDYYTKSKQARACMYRDPAGMAGMTEAEQMAMTDRVKDMMVRADEASYSFREVSSGNGIEREHPFVMFNNQAREDVAVYDRYAPVFEGIENYMRKHPDMTVMGREDELTPEIRKDILKNIVESETDKSSKRYEQAVAAFNGIPSSDEPSVSAGLER